MRHLGELNIVKSSQSAFIEHATHATSYHVTSALRFVCSCDTRVWRSFVYHALCVAPARVALTRARVCPQDMICAHVKLKRKRKIHFMFITLLPLYVAPMYSHVTNVFVFSIYHTSE